MDVGDILRVLESRRRKDYKDAAAAREAALRDLKRRGGEGMSRTAVIASSDRTGNFAVARAKTPAGNEEIAVGFGKSAAEAEASAFDKLAKTGATASRTVMYRYFSYGSDGPR